MPYKNCEKCGKPITIGECQNCANSAKQAGKKLQPDEVGK